MLPPLADIIANLEFLDDWEERYRYLIELGRMTAPLPEDAKSPANKVEGCASQVWLETMVDSATADPILHLRGESDAHIVKGLVALLLAFYSGRSANDILQADAAALFGKLGLIEHLTPQRANGVKAMIERIRRDAAKAQTPEAPSLQA